MHLPPEFKLLSDLKSSQYVELRNDVFHGFLDLGVLSDKVDLKLFSEKGYF